MEYRANALCCGRGGGLAGGAKLVVVTTFLGVVRVIIKASEKAEKAAISETTACARKNLMVYYAPERMPMRRIMIMRMSVIMMMDVRKVSCGFGTGNTSVGHELLKNS